MPVQDAYFSLLEKGKSCLQQLVANAAALSGLAECDSHLADFSKFSDILKARPETQVCLLAHREYQFALYALSIGNYRHAFISLRLFFELSLAAIDFSAHELRFRRWSARLDDIIWAKLLDGDTGVYSDAFLRPFNAELAPLGRQYSTLASKVYRECSEYVHGNVNTHPELDTPLEFNEALTLAWVDKAKTIRRCIVFANSARFLNFISPEDRNTIEPIVLDVLGDIPAIQAYYAHA
jgi:hypothetical protein